MSKYILLIDGKYRLYSNGDLFNTKSGRQIKRIINFYGYPCYNLYTRGVRKFHTVHRLVASNFVPPYTGEVVNHMDGNKENNLSSNLEWCTIRENCQHARRMGLTDDKGEKSKFAKLKEYQVLEIRNLKTQGQKTRELSERYGVTTKCIQSILARKTWKHI
jgi:hypothetical protein